MGKVYSRLLRPLRTFNISNRAERVISKDKPTPAPQYSYVEKQKALVDKMHPDFMETHLKKDMNLDDRLKEVFVTSNQSASSDEVSTKSLPQDKTPPPVFEYGIYEPAVIPEGKCSLRQAIEFISKYDKNPTENCIENIAQTYKLDKKIVENIVKHFIVPTFEKVPDTDKSAGLLGVDLSKLK